MAVVKAQITVRLGVEVYAKMKRVAENESRSMTNMIEYLLKKHIDAYEKENGKIELTDEDYGLE